VATERCVYDNAAGSDFIVDRVGRIVVGCGTSGHAFKFGPLLGELLADLAEDRRPPVDLTRFSLRRSPVAPDGPRPTAG
jgi:sarcosine oxidase